jgi:hypothetical protein
MYGFKVLNPSSLLEDKNQIYKEPHVVYKLD